MEKATLEEEKGILNLGPISGSRVRTENKYAQGLPLNGSGITWKTNDLVSSQACCEYLGWLHPRDLVLKTSRRMIGERMIQLKLCDLKVVTHRMAPEALNSVLQTSDMTPLLVAAGLSKSLVISG